jgi:hypothetical protein
MEFTQTTIYQKAFNQYLRRGTPIEVSIKALLAVKAEIAPVAKPSAKSYYVWATVGDDKVRASHAANDGMIFSWDDPPSTGHPSEETGCRCSAEPYDGNDAIEPLYPELLLIPFLRIGRGAIAAAVRAIRWISKSSKIEKHDGLTDHGTLRSNQRGISADDANTAIQTATAVGKVTTKIGKYGTRQYQYEGTNGVTVVVETEGRNAGKVITFWRNQ